MPKEYKFNENLSDKEILNKFQKEINRLGHNTLATYLCFHGNKKIEKTIEHIWTIEKINNKPELIHVTRVLDYIPNKYKPISHVWDPNAPIIFSLNVNYVLIYIDKNLTSKFMLDMAHLDQLIGIGKNRESFVMIGAVCSS